MIQLTTNFNLSEFSCRDRDGTPVPFKYRTNALRVAVQLQVLRDYLGEPVRILSAYRTPSHNKAVGGATKSFHLTGSAADITTKNKSPRQLATIVERLIAKGSLKFGGLGLYKGFIHVDIRPNKVRW